MTRAACYSAFNPIEHVCSPASVVFFPVAPALQSGIDKEKIAFDRATNAIAHHYWHGLTFDGFPVQTQPIVVNKDNYLYDDYDHVQKCLKCLSRVLHEYKCITIWIIT